MALLRLDDPKPRLPANRPGWQAFSAMAFRPLYLGAALFGALAILVWIADFAGTAALPGMLWHGHEMIWGYAGAVIVGFLLTAVATWTGQPALRGVPLLMLCAVWALARLITFADATPLWLTGVLSVGFFAAAAVALALPIWRARNTRNAALPFMLLAFAAADALFLLSVSGVVDFDARRLLLAGLMLVAGFITLIGLRVIPFFTHRALQRAQISHPRWAGGVAMLAPLVLAALVIGHPSSPSALALATGVAGMAFNLVLLLRNAHRSVFAHPLVWVLFAGYGLTALGLGLTGLALSAAPSLLSAAVHSIAIGGIGVLTLGMMTRTALGHTGRAMVLPGSMVPAYGLMLLATALRIAAAFPAMPGGSILIDGAGISFALALALFVWRYGRWLISTRADGLPG